MCVDSRVRHSSRLSEGSGAVANLNVEREPCASPAPHYDLAVLHFIAEVVVLVVNAVSSLVDVILPLREWRKRRRWKRERDRADVRSS